MLKLYWTLLEPVTKITNVYFWIQVLDNSNIADRLLVSGPVTQRYMARIIYKLVSDYNLTIGEAKHLWYKMTRDFGIPPYVDDKEYFIPRSAKFCQCHHFLYEHSDYTSLTSSNNFGLIKTGCLKCGCKEFRQIKKSA
jgi:hypothetical protein